MPEAVPAPGSRECKRFHEATCTFPPQVLTKRDLSMQHNMLHILQNFSLHSAHLQEISLILFVIQEIGMDDNLHFIQLKVSET